jgi:putative ABC transport system permease protein
MLFGDRAKYLLLISGIAAATILMVQGMALGFGLLGFASATADNVRSPIWVDDPLSQQVNDNQPLRDTDVDRVRSVDGVAWAVSLYTGAAQVRLVGQEGYAKAVLLVGLDPTTLMGAPTQIIAGSLEDLRLPDAVFVDQASTKLLSPDPNRPLVVGDSFEMNDRRAVIVGVCICKPSFGGGSYVFTTYDRAVLYVPGQRKMVSHVLAVPDAGRDVGQVIKAIHEQTGLLARDEPALRTASAIWLLKNSPAPFIIGVIVVIGFVVGTVVSGQTFYSFVFENSRYLGTLRAMGAETRTLAVVILAQALTVGLVGYGIGVGVLSAVFSQIPAGRLPLLMLWPVPVSVLAAVTGICLFSALLGIRRIARLEPAVVFRG